MIVIDASVVVKWFVREQDSNKAFTVLRSEEYLLAPELIFVEVSSALTKLVRIGTLGENDVKGRLTRWHQYVTDQIVSIEPMLAYLSAAEDLSIALCHPLQDCLYLALAQQVQAPLLTADIKFFNKARKENHPVQLLSEMSVP